MKMATIISTILNENISIDHVSLAILQSTYASTICVFEMFNNGLLPFLLALTNTSDYGGSRRLIDQLPRSLTTSMAQPGTLSAVTMLLTTSTINLTDRIDLIVLFSSLLPWRTPTRKKLPLCRLRLYYREENDAVWDGIPLL